MIDFQTPALSDKAWVDDFLRAEPKRACDYTFANLFMWAPAYGTRIARLGGRLAVQVSGLEQPAYLWPVGEGDERDALLALTADAGEWGRPFRLVAVSRGQTERLEAMFPGQFQIREERGDFDYLYTVEKLAELGGKKLHAKRNHINRFLKDNPTWTYAEMTPADLPECMAMDEQWYLRSKEREGREEEPDLKKELSALNRAAANFDGLELEGGVLRVYGEVVAFTIGSVLAGDTYDVHYEKAYSELQGAYAMINYQFARQVREKHPEIAYLNRENDMGLEGLRKAKESYYPDLMLEKFSAVRLG